MFDRESLALCVDEVVEQVLRALSRRSQALAHLIENESVRVLDGLCQRHLGLFVGVFELALSLGSSTRPIDADAWLKSARTFETSARNGLLLVE